MTNGPGGASASATATGGEDSWPFEQFYGEANATSTAEADFGGVMLKSTVVASSPLLSPFGTTVAASASTSAFSIAFPDEATAQTLTDGASAIADDPGDIVFGIAILAMNGEYTGALDFSPPSSYRGDVFINGYDYGPGDLELAFSGPGTYDFIVYGAVPEPSTWAMMLIGFAGLGFVGWRRASAGG